MFCYKIQWFYQDLESENLCFLNLYSVHAARILDLSLEIILSLFLLAGTSIIFLFLEAKFINVFKMRYLAVNFDICSVKFRLVIES